jgi:hypothetical protein
VRVLTGLLLVLAVACGSPGGSDSSTLPVLDSAGGGFKTKISSVLDLQTAAASTPAPTAATKAALGQAGYSSGAERVFTRGDEFVTIVSFALSTDVDAGQFVEFEQASLKSTPAAVLYEDGSIPGSFGYDLSGGTRSGNRIVFCQGVWFAAHSTVYGVTDCAGSPRYPDLVESLALKQFRQAS